MAGIGEDIKDVLQELGTPFTIIHVNGDSVSGESLDYEMYFEQSTEFIRQNCYSGDFQFDTQIVQGDLILFDNKKFLMMNVKKTLFENEVVDFSNFFVETNVLGRFSKSFETRDSSLKKVTIWLDNKEVQHITDATPIEDDVYALTFGEITLTTAALSASATTSDLAEALRVSDSPDYESMPFVLTHDTGKLVLSWKETGDIVDSAVMVKTVGSGTPVTSDFISGEDRDSIPGTMLVSPPSNEEMESVDIILDKYTLFTQAHNYVVPGDRWYPDINDQDEYFKVLSVDKYRFDGLLSIKLTEDIRE